LILHPPVIATTPKLSHNSQFALLTPSAAQATPAMVATSVEQLKLEYTDKYVKVDAARPELARFRDVVGQVKTVNMSGRALVEFLDYHLNIGWFDIDLSCLTVVPKPTDEERAAAKAKASEEKPAGKAAPTTGAKQTADAKKPAVAGTKAGGAPKMSVADMLAAARGGGGGGAAAAKPAAAKPKAEAPAKAAAPKAAAPGAPMDRSKMSVADMLAAARAGGAAPAAAPAAEEAAEEAPAKVAPAAKPAKAAAAKPAGGKVDRSTMSVAEMIAYCRQADAG
jgi:hypothetical protein